MKRLLVAGLIATLNSGSVNATVFTYNVAGTFVDGSILSGSFAYDDSKTTFSQYQDVNILLSGRDFIFDSIPYITSGFMSPFFSLNFQSKSEGTTAIELAFNAVHDGANLIAITDGNLIAADSHYTVSLGGPNPPEIGLVAGTITLQSAVPEPASWAMLIAGFGLIGGAMRRRQRISVTFA